MTTHTHRKLRRVVEKNIDYLANLVALEAWYTEVRRPFFAAQDLGPLVYEGALAVLTAARKERTSRLVAMVATVSPDDDARRELRDHIAEVTAVFASPELPDGSDFTNTLSPAAGYLATIQHLPPEVAARGVSWLQAIVTALRARVSAVVPTMNLYAAN